MSALPFAAGIADPSCGGTLPQEGEGPNPIEPALVTTADLPGIPRTGNKLKMTATVIHRIEDGKLAEKRSGKDVLGFLQQLGIIPTPEQAPS